MIKKVQVIPYKTVKGMVYYFLGKRRGLDLWQPITGHVGDNARDETISDAARREAREEIGIAQFRNFFNTQISFVFTSDSGDEFKEHIFAAEIGEQPIKLEKAEFEKFIFLPYRGAMKKLTYNSQKECLRRTDKILRKKTYPKVFVIAGAGASGKSTIINKVITKDRTLIKARTCTTRKRRPGEKPNYFFLTKRIFKRWKNDGKFIETNFFNGSWYGALKTQVEKPIGKGRNVITELDINGVISIKKVYSNVVAVFIIVPLADLKRRFILRGQDTPENIERRLKIAKREMKARRVCDYIVQNKWGKLEQATNDLSKIIMGGRGE